MGKRPKIDKKNQGRKVKKRRFHGNQFIVPDCNESSTAHNKLKDCSFSTTTDPKIGYEIINFVTVFSTIATFVVCKECGENVKFEKDYHRGLGFKITVTCSKCADRFVYSCPTSVTQKNIVFEINSRIMAVMRYIGIGYSGIELFCGLMDLPVPLVRRSYDVFIKSMRNVAKSVCQLSLNSAMTEETSHYENTESLIVSGDGSWRKRGFQSLHGIASLIGHYTGKVVDVVIKSSYCAACKLWEKRSGTDAYVEWLNGHEEECRINHEGSAGKMEVDAIIEMFQRSDELYGVKYKYYVGDGDSKTFKSILDKHPYGEEFQVLKKECVGHVQKRMGTRLRNTKKEHKGIGGRGKLSDKLIGELSKYYGMAIRNNCDDVQKMKDAIMATFYHKCSTDDNLQHHLCPEGADSWCSWKKAKLENNLGRYKHKPALPLDVQEAILPIYNDLSNEELLTRCIGGFTQNANESFNNMVWKIASKRTFSGQEIVEIATYLSAATFNDGCKALLFLLEEIGVKVGARAEAVCAVVDQKRLHDADISLQNRSKTGRIQRRINQQRQADAEEALQISYYSAGAH